jgi:hypothetical protein
MAQKGLGGRLSPWELKWQERVEEWQRSGQRQTQFCLERGISVSSFSHWKCELLRRQRSLVGPGKGSATPGAASESVSSGSVEWTEVLCRQSAAEASFASGASSGAGLELVLPSGCSIRLGPRFEAEALKRLLGVLGSGPC